MEGGTPSGCGGGCDPEIPPPAGSHPGVARHPQRGGEELAPGALRGTSEIYAAQLKGVFSAPRPAATQLKFVVTRPSTGSLTLVAVRMAQVRKTLFDPSG